MMMQRLIDYGDGEGYSFHHFDFNERSLTACQDYALAREHKFSRWPTPPCLASWCARWCSPSREICHPLYLRANDLIIQDRGLLHFKLSFEDSKIAFSFHTRISGPPDANCNMKHPPHIYHRRQYQRKRSQQPLLQLIATYERYSSPSNQRLFNC